MFEVATIGLVVTMILALIRAAKGPTVFDRILAVNMFGTMTVLLIAVSGFYYARPDWDVALTIEYNSASPDDNAMLDCVLDCALIK